MSENDWDWEPGSQNLTNQAVAESQAEEKSIPVQFYPVDVLDPQPVAAMLEGYRVECNLTLDRAKEITIIRDPETNAKAVEWAAQAKDLHKRLENHRKEIVAPHNQYLHSVNGFFKLFTEPLLNAEKYLGRLSANYRQFQENEARRIQAEQEAEARKLQKKLEEEAAQAKERDVHYEPIAIVAPVAPEVPRVTRTAAGSASQRKTWSFEIEDIDLIPREYLIPDLQKIRQDIKGGVRNIPGIRIFEEYTTQIRT